MTGILAGPVPDLDEDLDRARPGPDQDEVTDAQGALTVLRRGLAASPELRRGLTLSIAGAAAAALGRIAVPVLVQQIVDRGLVGDDEYRGDVVLGLGVASAAVIVAVAVVMALTQRRLVRAAQAALLGLRSRAFAKIHELSIADHHESRRGVWVSRVTSDIETLARFAEWGAISWIVQTLVLAGVVVALVVYSWQLSLVVVLTFVPVVPLFRVVQRRQLAAYDRERVAVGDTLSGFSEAVGGAAVIRAYGMGPLTRRRLRRSIDRQYRTEMDAAKYFAMMFPLSDVVASLAVALVTLVGVTWGPGWGLQVGEMIAVLFLVTLAQGPIAELSEVLDQTQVALAGWRKVLDLLDQPVDVVEPQDGLDLPAGPLSIGLRDVGFAYRDGEAVLAGITAHIEPGTSVAIVGETGSGKSTLARLLCRLADPTTGVVEIGGVDLRAVSAAARRRGIRMVPQDGFLFDTTVRENVRMGRAGATSRHVEAAFDEVGLGAWVEQLPAGLETGVGARGEALSVGERQLVALARAQLADPGLLVLDEATASVDARTERAMAEALERVSRGRTTLSIAHRLSTAAAADLVMVLDRGRLVEVGTHDDLVGRDGIYARLHRSWIGATQGLLS